MQPTVPGLSNWFETPLGAYLLRRELAYFDAEVVDVFGFNALQFGLAEYDFLRMSRVPMRAAVGHEGPVRLRADLCELPVASGEVDIVAMPHTLEFSPNPHQALREVQRVLRPEGRLVVSGFNPWSLWGAARLLRSRSGEFPWCGQFVGLARIKDWLALLGFEVTAGRMTAYAPPCRGEQWLERMRFMEHAGDRWWPFAGGVYFLHAVKRVTGMRLITPKWRMSTAKRKVLAPIPQRIAEQRSDQRADDR
ncbi:MAG: class I SAM-dependent methyltransferase [Betaproteobacteria bacterium]